MKKKNRESSVVLPLPSEVRLKLPHRHAVRNATIGLALWFLACTGAGVMLAMEVKMAAQFNFQGEATA